MGEWERELFGNVNETTTYMQASLVGPDGMAFDIEGNLHVCVVGQGDVTVLDPTGKVIKRTKIKGGNPTNIAFSRTNPSEVLITDAGNCCLLKGKCDTEGLELFYN